MNDASSLVGYCTNVHAGADLPTTLANLEVHTLAVKRLVSPDRPMGVGLWLSARTAERILAEKRSETLAEWFQRHQVVPYTLNGFPYGDFHQRVVKHQVYFPTWWQRERLEYTLDLIAIQHAILPPDRNGTISTLPISWGSPRPTHEQLEKAAANLVTVAERLRRLERETGRYISLCLEPEPGCYFQRCQDVVRFFHDYLWQLGDISTVQRYLQVCHDICHSAVMMESQSKVLQTYHTAEITVGKVQVSAAVTTPDLNTLSPEERHNILSHLSEFHEERYLHQTVIREDPESELEFYEDLPLALADWKDRELRGVVRVHFHVPIYAEDLGALRTTQADILDCIEAIAFQDHEPHFEIETYAWGVLPERWRRSSLAEGIAEEVNWFQSITSRRPGNREGEDAQ